LHGGLELRAIDALEGEELVVERTIEMVFAVRTGDTGAAFVNGALGDGEPGEAFTRAVRGLFGEVAGDNGGVHNFDFFE
jgi:hypothetical protein